MRIAHTGAETAGTAATTSGAAASRIHGLTDTVTLFLAMLAVVAQAAVLVALVLGIGGRAMAVLRRGGALLIDGVGTNALWFATGVATISFVGSLYFSEGAHFVPCELCWYQRIAMYPLVPILAVAAWRGDTSVRRYALPLSIIGGLVAAYHMLVERFPSLESGTCDPENPCSLIWVERFGYITIPTMALSAFALITLLLIVARPVSQEE